MDVTIIHQDMDDNSTHIFVPVMAILIAILAISGGDGYSMGAMVSDERLKTDITQVGVTDAGIGIYEWRYIWDEQMYHGVLAQDVLMHRPDAVVPMGGFYAVDYDALGLEMVAID